MEQLLSLVQAAKLAGVKPALIRRLVHAGKIPAVRVGQVHIRIHPDDFQAYLRASVVTGPTPARNSTKNGRKSPGRPRKTDA